MFSAQEIVSKETLQNSKRKNEANYIRQYIHTHTPSIMKNASIGKGTHFVEYNQPASYGWQPSGQYIPNTDELLAGFKEKFEGCTVEFVTDYTEGADHIQKTGFLISWT